MGLDEGAEPLNPSFRVRVLWRHLLRRVKYLLGREPALLPILLRLTPLGTSRRITATSMRISPVAHKCTSSLMIRWFWSSHANIRSTR